jgi:putative peptidoglycan lipid II flippase
MKLALSLGFLTAANAILTLLTNWYILTTVGAGEHTDAYYAAMAVPQFILAVIGGALATVLIPILAGESEVEFKKQAWSFFWFVAISYSALAVLLSLSAFLWGPLLVAGSSETTQSLMVKLTDIQLIGMVFSALAGLLAAVGNARSRFLWVGTTPLIAALVSLSILIWGLPRYGITIAVWSTVVRGFVHMALLLPFLGSFRGLENNRYGLRLTWERLKPPLCATTYSKSGPLVDRFISSMLPPGGLSLFYLAFAAHSVGNDMIYKTLTIPMLALLANHAKRSNQQDFQRVYRKRLRWVSLLTGAAVLAVVFAGEPVLRLAIGRNLSADKVRLLWVTLCAMGGFLVGGAIGQISAAAFYATGDTKTPTKVGILGFTLGSALKIIGLVKFGLIGMAVATSLHQCFNALVLHVLLKRKRHQAFAPVLSG